jgi:hypothetical protein
MDDIKRAAKILGVESGTSLEEAEQIYDDKLQDIKWAIHVLRQTSQEGGKQLQSTQIAEQINDQAASDEFEEPVRSASLFDDAFSDRIDKSKSKRVPLWLIAAPVLLIVVLLAYLAAPAGEVGEEPADQIGVDESVAPGILGEEEAISAPPTALPPGPPTPKLPSAEKAGTASTEPQPSPAIEKPEPEPDPEPSQAAVRQEPTPVPRPPRASPRQDRPVLRRSGGESSDPETNATPSPSAVTPPAQEESLEEIEEVAEPVSEPEEPKIDPAAQEAFETLMDQSYAASKLFNNLYPQITFKEWRPLPKGEEEILIDLLATVDGSGQDTHFIWTIEKEAGTVKALSQAARDLEVSENR